MHLINFCRTNYVLISTDNYGNLVFFSKLPKLALLPFLPLAKKLRQGNVFTPVCHSVHRGRECLPHSWADTTGADTHWTDTPPWADTPLPSACWDTHTPCPVHAEIHPPLHNACWDTVNKWAVRILLECILVV